MKAKKASASPMLKISSMSSVKVMDLLLVDKAMKLGPRFILGMLGEELLFELGNKLIPIRNGFPIMSRFFTPTTPS